MDNSTIITGGVTDQLLQCRTADWALTALVGFIMLIVCFWQFKDEMDYQVKPVVTLFFALAISIHIYLDWLSTYFNDSVAEWIVWVIITVGLAIVLLAAKKQWLAICIFFYVGFPGVEVWGKLAISVVASILFFIGFMILPAAEKLFKTFGESLMVVVNFLVAVITMISNAGRVGWPDNCILNHYNGFMICMVRCGSVTTNNDMVHVYWLVGVAVVLAIIRTTWIRWRPGPNSIDFNKRLYCCLGCCSCCYVDPVGGEYDQLDAATKQQKKKKDAKNVKRVSVNDTKKKTTKGKGGDNDGTTSESRGKGHVDHAIDDINLAPLDQFLDEDDKQLKKKKKKERSSKERQNGIKPRLSGDDDDESDDNDDLPHEVKADDSHQFVIAETDNGLPLEEEEDDGVGVDLEKIIRGATVAESKRTQPPQNATVTITVTQPPPPPQSEKKKAIVAATTAQQAEEAMSLV